MTKLARNRHRHVRSRRVAFPKGAFAAPLGGVAEALREAARVQVIVTRPRAQAGPLVGRLEALGVEVVECPLIEIERTSDEPVDCAGYDWLVVTSPNGADEIARRAVNVPRVAAVGPGTAEALRAHGHRAGVRRARVVAGRPAAGVSAPRGPGALRGGRRRAPRADRRSSAPTSCRSTARGCSRRRRRPATSSSSRRVRPRARTPRSAGRAGRDDRARDEQRRRVAWGSPFGPRRQLTTSTGWSLRYAACYRNRDRRHERHWPSSPSSPTSACRTTSSGRATGSSPGSPPTRACSTSPTASQRRTCCRARSCCATRFRSRRSEFISRSSTRTSAGIAGRLRSAPSTAGSSSVPTTASSMLAADDVGIDAAHEITNPAYRLKEVSRTFHARDVFAPAAAHLANGVPGGRPRARDRRRDPGARLRAGAGRRHLPAVARQCSPSTGSATSR